MEDGDGMPKSEKIRECGRFDFKDGFKYSGEVFLIQVQHFLSFFDSVNYHLQCGRSYIS